MYNILLLQKQEIQEKDLKKERQFIFKIGYSSNNEEKSVSLPYLQEWEVTK